MLDATQANTCSTGAIAVTQPALIQPEQDAYVKRPSDVMAIPFTFDEFIAEHGPVTYVIRADAGLSVTQQPEDASGITLEVSAGAVGRVYQFGVEARSADGFEMELKLRTMRVREPAQWAELSTDAEELHHATEASYTKRVAEVRHVPFDFRDFVAGLGGATAVYSLRFEPGIGAVLTETAPGLLDVALSGGAVGRVYEFGVEASTTDGSRSLVMVSMVRLREPTAWSGLSTSTIADDAGPFLADADDTLLVNDSGQILY